MDRHLAIRNTHENVGVINGDNDAWDLDGNKITIDEAKVVEEIKRLQADYDSKQYQRDRAVSYPSIQDQLDMQYHDAIDGTTTWKDSIAKVKADNPKPQ